MPAEVLSPARLLQLIQQAKSGDSDAFGDVFRQHRRRIYGIANGFFAPGADRDDLLQEATIGFFKAIRDFDSTQGTFSNFLILCVRRQLLTYIKQSTAAKHSPLNRALSIDARIDGDPARTLADVLPSRDILVESLESAYASALDSISSLCSPLEKDILHLYSRGFEYADIATVLSVNTKVINNALWRVKLKAKKAGVSSQL